MKLPPEKFQGEGESKQLCLNSAEELFADLRDRNFNAVGPVLSREAKSLSSQYDVRHEAKTIGEIKQFVDRLPSMQLKKKSLANRTFPSSCDMPPNKLVIPQTHFFLAPTLTDTSIAELIKEVTDQEAFFDALAIEQGRCDFLAPGEKMDTSTCMLNKQNA